MNFWESAAGYDAMKSILRNMSEQTEAIEKLNKNVENISNLLTEYLAERTVKQQSAALEADERELD